jgi:hypothetical protein
VEDSVNDLQVAVATVLGALLVVVGAWLLVMRRDASQNRAKFLGLEFELSTPALAVLLIGAGLLIGPAFAPHRPGGWPVLSMGATPSGGADTPGTGTLFRQQTVTTSELEPNNRPAEANVVAYGSTVSGALGNNNLSDYFSVATPPDQTGQSRVIVRLIQYGMIKKKLSVRYKHRVNQH